MREFFKPWRRKIGRVTLVLSCAFMAGWVRSFDTPANTSFLSDHDTFHRLVLSKGNLDWEWFHQAGVEHLSDVQFTTARLVIEKDRTRHLVWKWNFCGAGKGEYQSEVFDGLKSANPLLPFKNMTHCVWRIPYWIITVPLTLLSAWLLMISPKQKQARES